MCFAEWSVQNSVEIVMNYVPEGLFVNNSITLQLMGGVEQTSHYLAGCFI